MLRALVCELAHRDDRVAKDAQIGPRALPLDWVERVGVAAVEMSQQRGGEVAAGRRAHDANALWVEEPFGRAGPDGSHGARGVLQHGRVVVTTRAEAVIEHEAGDALLVKPPGVIAAFVPRQGAVAAAPTVAHPRPRRPVGV